MADARIELDDLVDLKMLPAWVNEPAPGERFAHHQGEREPRDERRSRHGPDRRKRRPQNRDRSRPDRPTSKPEESQTSRDRPPRDRFRGKKRGERRGPHGKDRHRGRIDRKPAPEKPLPPIQVKFLPRPAALENVIAQIQSGTVAYSLFSLARLFLEKPTRYEVKLTAPADVPIFQLGENGAASTDREFLERSAFRFARPEFYKVEVTETEPIKGNFSNVARCRLSGTVLGPTNHHDYQRRLRNLYEQRFSRRMSFPEYQHKIEIVSDPAVVEKWKEDARKVTTFTTTRAETPETFSSEADAERHFRQNYLNGLIRTVSEVTISARDIADRVLRRVVEQAWTHETRSPSAMMQELAARLRESGLHIFRHRRGMLFVSSIYPRAFTAEQTAVSSQVRTIVEAIAASPRIGRKELADKLIVNLSGDDAERAKLALASDLLWLISAGHVIEFNDGSLDLPRAKAKKKENLETGPSRTGTAPAAEQKENAAAEPKETASPASKSKDVAPEMSAAEKEARVEAGAPPVDESSQDPNQREDVVAAAVSAGEEESRQSNASEETEIGGS